MKPVARMYLQNGGVTVVLTDTEHAAIAEAIYAWTTPGGEWLRVGTSAAPVGKRLLAYSKDISRSLRGEKSPTPNWEAAQWKRELEQHGELIALAYQPDLVQTIAGPVRPFLDIERALIRAKKPRLNRSHR